MQERDLKEVWQVDVNGTVYEAPFDELGEWIGGGSLLPEDKVRKGNLRWIEAKKVPALVPFFNAKAKGEPMPLMVTSAVADAPVTPPEPEPTETVEFINLAVENAPAADDGSRAPAQLSDKADPAFCALHGGFASSYVCDGCGHGFCKACPKSFGGTVKICPLCGAFCRTAREAEAAREKAETQTRALQEGFGIADFFAALGYPFRFKVSLVLGGAMFMFFTLGRGAGGMGGIFMIVAGIFATMCANALTFGVLAHTIDNFVQGKLQENFMPDFDDFSLWDDVVHPFFLSIAAYVSAFGPFVVVLLIGFYLITSSVSNKMDSYQSDLEKIPGTNVYAGRKLADQSDDVKDVLTGISQKEKERVESLTTTAADAGANAGSAGTSTPVIDQESREQEELWAMATESQKQSLESTLGKSPETEARQQAETVQAFLGLAAPIVVIGAIAFVWGLFFFPAACAVAGYTRLFRATINPLVGLDTIKRLGIDYVKILLMGLVLGLLSLFVTGMLGAIFGAFNLPGIGNLPAAAIGSFVTFYLSIVFSCILGFALYKSADKLGLSR